MKTPKEYSDNLKKGIITDEMISDVLFSYSKRAKNCRDKIREYNAKLKSNYVHFHSFDNIEQYENKMEMLYGKKDAILKKYKIQPSCIHRINSNRRKRIYDYEKEYEEIIQYKRNSILWTNKYYDYDNGKEVWFVDIPDEENKYLYFLYFEYPKHSFHNPIEKEDLEKYNNLNICDIEKLETYGEDINELLSLQFCDKVYNFLKNVAF